MSHRGEVCPFEDVGVGRGGRPDASLEGHMDMDGEFPYLD